MKAGGRATERRLPRREEIGRIQNGQDLRPARPYKPPALAVGYIYNPSFFFFSSAVGSGSTFVFTTGRPGDFSALISTHFF